MTIENLILIYLLAINVVTFIVFGIDKSRARNHRWRISEATLFILAILGGSVGAELGIHIFHHKTRHLRFVIGIPLILILQLLVILLALRCLEAFI